MISCTTTAVSSPKNQSIASTDVNRLICSRAWSTLCEQRTSILDVEMSVWLGRSETKSLPDAAILSPESLQCTKSTLTSPLLTLVTHLASLPAILTRYCQFLVPTGRLFSLAHLFAPLASRSPRKSILSSKIHLRMYQYQARARSTNLVEETAK